jgi:class 3 adenylate cyclase/tetratricopeptide (TPR) repeat protein
MRPVIECVTCGTQSPDGFRFCPACGASLGDAPVTEAPGAGPVAGAPAEAAARPTEERRIVTALFCDLVGFTATSEQADPEDVDRMLSAYGAMARTEIERHGGTIEKFIGDAVVGVFGIPVTHEDDALRAVRAGLDIASHAAELKGPHGIPLRLRVGINTGEVLARMAVQPGSGDRFLAGDAINTASRIQSAAPEMGVAVGLETYEATRAAINYAPLEAVHLKGKSEPVRIFHATGVRSRTGVEATPTNIGAYIGRTNELDRLQGLFSEIGANPPVKLVTVVAEAGMGKSRLLLELRAALERTHRSLTWRQGRCLPYGEGITFWALGEIVKAEAGILESDPASVVQAKLAAVIPDGTDSTWIHERLLPLVGVESGQTSREESFAAWRAFLEGLTAKGPAVVVVEDLHWADDALLAFLEDAARESTRGPLFLLATARPEFLGTQPDFAANLPNAHRLELAPLSTEDTAALVASLLGSVVPPELTGPIVERADGNPLYAEEYVALLRDRDLLVEADGVAKLRPGVELPVPTSIHGLLAARLDTLPVERKALMSDAAVVGKVFWDGALVAMDRTDRPAVDVALADLAEQSFVRQNVQSSMAGEEEYSFWHMLGRDVAYRQLPRGARAQRHAAAATWLETKLGERVDDLADVLADHWRNALQLSRAAGEEERAAAYEPKAINFLVRAGDRARGLDTAAATSRYEAALALTPPGHPQRTEVLLRFGSVAYHQLRFEEAIAALDEAIDAWSGEDEWQLRGRAMVQRLLAQLESGDEDFARRLAMTAAVIELLEAHEPTPELVEALTERGIDLINDSRPDEALEVFDRALEAASSLGMRIPGRTLGFRGETRLHLGDAQGMDDLRASREIAREIGRGRDLVIATVNTGNWQAHYEGAQPAIETVLEAISLAERFGYAPLANAMRHMSCQFLIDAGHLDEADEMLAVAQSRQAEPMPTTAEHRIQALRGQEAEALAGAARIEQEMLPQAGIDDVRVVILSRLMEIRACVGHHEDALRDLKAVLAIERRADTESYVGLALPTLIRAACNVGRTDLAERILEEAARAPFPYSVHAHVAARALVAEQQGRLEDAVEGFRDAADRWASFTTPIEEAHARIGHARCLVALGRHADAVAPLAAAREIGERMGAKPMLADVALIEARLSSAAPA